MEGQRTIDEAIAELDAELDGDRITATLAEAVVLVAQGELLFEPAA